jgi:tRNA pseudouridine38-40 synthase
MPRFKLTIEYDGRPFVGWQVQDNGISVQGVLTAAVAAFCGDVVHVRGAGRTDAGVHALGQVAHLDLAKAWDADTVRDALNFHLRPHPVAVLAAEPAADDFDARFSAVKRHYLYRIVNRRADLALDAGRALRVPRPLDAAAMNDAAQRLVGRHDFTTFRATECQAFSALVAAVSSGQISCEEAAAVSTLLDAQRKAIETETIEKRLDALEARK